MKNNKFEMTRGYFRTTCGRLAHVMFADTFSSSFYSAVNSPASSYRLRVWRGALFNAATQCWEDCQWDDKGRYLQAIFCNSGRTDYKPPVLPSIYDLCGVWAAALPEGAEKVAPPEDCKNLPPLSADVQNPVKPQAKNYYTTPEGIVYLMELPDSARTSIAHERMHHPIFYGVCFAKKPFVGFWDSAGICFIRSDNREFEPNPYFTLIGELSPDAVPLRSREAVRVCEHAKDSLEVYWGNYCNQRKHWREFEQGIIHLPKKEKQPEPVNHPAHYNQGKIEVIDFIDDQKLGFALGNAVKYICRAEHKGKPLEDLKKAAWYINHEIKKIEGTGE